MGPIALFDLVGLDTAQAIVKVMVDAYPDRAMPSPFLEELVHAGRLGQKSGAGFRKHGGKRPQPDPTVGPLLEHHRLDRRAPDEAEITDRLFLPMLVEATRVVEEGIVRDPADLDMGVILGIGFPAFRGGLLRWCDSLGAEQVVSRLSHYEALGPRFEPTEILRRMAASGGSFFPGPRPAAGARSVPVA
jgi:3-hydroxyacyl-CoA dehydrogenase/enoyl-CoA hydratase/3-hydroxybutyryl-CoA epimerase/3-hydroxyacyl-CoA dehydrogenase/enoyl-CoA hydratase/3-hydroxybutyryl-CoA epimerase/enoyl-CoA isomerase